MKKTLRIAVVFTILLCFVPVNTHNKLLTNGNISSEAYTELDTTPNEEVREFLESKGSPLAPHTDFLLKQKHWKLLIAISAIESQYCKRQLGFNCWGIGGDSDYQHYDSIPDAIESANGLIERWQARGRWLTVEDMNCHYVVPCNPNWVIVVNQVLNQMENYERDRRLSQQETGDRR